MSFDENILIIPSYLDKQFFKTALEHETKVKHIEIVSLNLKKGSELGENYMSNIYRATIIYKPNGDTLKKVSLIIKTIPKTEDREFQYHLDIHRKETSLYMTVIPKMESILNGIKIAPKCYYATDEPVSTLVFEDLRADGFTLANTQKGLSESECKIVLEKLAKFHAASLYLLDKHPKLLGQTKYKYGFFTPESVDDPVVEAFFVDSLKTEISVVETWPGYGKYADQMKRIYFTIKERILALMFPAHDELKVLNHNDLWVNNFMFKYCPGNPSLPVDIRFLDFQASFLISPGIDLNYFLNTSVQFEVLKSRRDVLIQNYYYNSLKTTLESLEYEEIPSLETIKMEIRRKEFYGFVSAVSVLPIVCINQIDSDDCTFDTFANKETAEKKRLAACRTKRFEEVMKYMLKRAEELGVLD